MNRTIDQDVNLPVIFSLKMGTSNQNVILHDARSMKNVAYVAGQGEGADRIVVVLPSENIPSGFDRRERFVDARDATTNEELTMRGESKLAELGQVYHVNSVVGDTKDLEYDIGDIVTVMDYRTGEYENLQITGISDTEAGASVPQRSIVFGQAPMDIGQAIDSRLAGINNILTE